MSNQGMMPLAGLLEGISLGEFVPGYQSDTLLGEMFWLDEDVSYVSQWVHPAVSLLLHPETRAIIGFRAICRSTEKLRNDMLNADIASLREQVVSLGGEPCR